MLGQQLLKRLLVFDCASCEGFSTSGNAVVTVTGTCNKNRSRLQSVGRHELSCSLFPASQSMAYTRTLSLHHISSDGLTETAAKKKIQKNKQQKKNKGEADLLDSKGGFKSLPWVPTGRGEQQMVHLIPK